MYDKWLPIFISKYFQSTIFKSWSNMFYPLNQSLAKTYFLTQC
jgi:hypothetical protein